MFLPTESFHVSDQVEARTLSPDLWFSIYIVRLEREYVSPRLGVAISPLG